MVVVTHEMVVREVANQLVFMDEGIIMESGNSREMMANPQHERTKAFRPRCCSPYAGGPRFGHAAVGGACRCSGC